jgi:hypothetical protein
MAGSLQAIADCLSAIPFTEELRGFLKGRMSSGDQIDIVLLLLSDPSRSWTAPEVAERLKMAPESTAMRLFLLASGGLIVFEPSGVPRYRYAASDANTDRMLRELAAAYADNRAEILKFIEGPSTVDPIATFADAFKLKK